MAQTEITCNATIQDINSALSALGEKSELYSEVTAALVTAVGNRNTEVCVVLTNDEVVMSLSGLDESTCNRVKSIEIAQVSIIDLGVGQVALATQKKVASTATTSKTKPAGWPYSAGETLKKAMPEKEWNFPNPISQTPGNTSNASSSVMEYITTGNVITAAVVAGLGYAAYCFFGGSDE